MQQRAVDSTVVPRLDVRHASKTFAGRTVLSDVNLTVNPGEMQGIVGQNGSGKSTLAKVISGYYPPDRGTEIRVDGEKLPVPVRLRDLRSAGIAIVHQDLGLIEGASVIENVRIAAMTGSRWTRRVRWGREAREAQVALNRLGYSGPLRALVKDLPPADRARVAIARASQGHTPGHGLLIFDESTRALPAEALEDFYSTVRLLCDDGTAVLMIGHRLGEILEHCDRVTVLRDGKCVAEGVSTQGVSESDLATHMLGHSLSHLSFGERERSTEVSAAVIHDLEGPGLSRPFDLKLGRGEIVGVTGLPGAGFESIPYLIAGAVPARGTLELSGKKIDLASTSLAKLVKMGVALVPENRPRDGLGFSHSVTDNIALPWLGERGRFWATGHRWQQLEAASVIDRLGISPADPLHLVGRLSGGNQQKVLLGKWLVGAPRLLVMHEPTQAVDVKARQDLLRAIHEIAGGGTSVLIVSTEPEDLVTVCDRVLLFQEGAAFDEISEPFDSTRIIDAIYSGSAEPHAAVAGSANDAQGEMP